MPYEGDELNACGVFDIDCSRVALVAVSGSGPNVCGHLILGARSGRGDIYFHVVDPIGYPKYMNASNYQRYMRENKKRELTRRYLDLPNPDGAVQYLERLLSKTWVWGILPHNCVHFVEEVVAAGGATWGSYSNCPVIAMKGDPIDDRVRRYIESQTQQLMINVDNGMNNLLGLAK
jgi:hypothetical protein